MKRKTVGVDPKLIGQLVASAITWVLARYIPGLGLPPEAEASIAALVGVIVGALFPAPKTVPVETGA